MSDPLDLIAEAQKRQRDAERDRDHWKGRWKHERARCRAVIDLLKLRPMPPPDIDEEGFADWDKLERAVREMAKVIRDPYALFDDEDEPTHVTHDQAIERMTYRLHAMIQDAVKKARQT